MSLGLVEQQVVMIAHRDGRLVQSGSSPPVHGLDRADVLLKTRIAPGCQYPVQGHLHTGPGAGKTLSARCKQGCLQPHAVAGNPGLVQYSEQWQYITSCKRTSTCASELGPRQAANWANSNFCRSAGAAVAQPIRYPGPIHCTRRPM